jgi:hypothetical protein
VLWLELVVEANGALVIGVGMLLAAWRFVADFPPAVVTFADVRLTLARFLAIALEFQLGADILSTAVAPTWDQAGDGRRYSDGSQPIFSATTCGKLAYSHAKLRSELATQ